MLLGRFLVGIGMGIGPPVAALYVAEVQMFLHIFLTEASLIIHAVISNTYFYLIQFSPLSCAGFTCFCQGYLWKLDPNCYMPWTHGSSFHWNPCKRNCWLVRMHSRSTHLCFVFNHSKVHLSFCAQVACLFLGIYNSSCNACSCYDFLCGESTLAVQGLFPIIFCILQAIVSNFSHFCLSQKEWPVLF